MAIPPIPSLGATRPLFDPPSLVFGRWVRPVGDPPKSLDLLIEVDYELWHVHVEGTDLTGPCHSVEEGLAATPELRRVESTYTTVHWSDVNRVRAADALEATSDSTMVLINGEWWHGELAGSEVVLVPSLPGGDEEYVTHLTWSDYAEGRAQAEWWGTDTEAVLAAIGNRYWVHYTNGHEWFLGMFEHRHDALVAFAPRHRTRSRRARR